MSEQLDVAALRRMRDRDGVIMQPVGDLLAEIHRLRARIPELERRILDKNFELTGVHEALRKETERAERLEKEADQFAYDLDFAVVWKRRKKVALGADAPEAGR